MKAFILFLTLLGFSFSSVGGVGGVEGGGGPKPIKDAILNQDDSTIITVDDLRDIVLNNDDIIIWSDFGDIQIDPLDIRSIILEDSRRVPQFNKENSTSIIEAIELQDGTFVDFQ